MKESEEDLLIEIMVFKLNAIVRNHAIYPNNLSTLFNVCIK